MDHRFAPGNIPPPPPFPPVRGHSAMDQLPHDFAAGPHTIEPPQHRNSIPTPGYGEDRRNLFTGGRDSVLESYTISRFPTYATAKRTRWNAKEDKLRELVKKQQKRGTSAYVPLNKNSEIKHSRRSQVARLVQDRNTHRLNDPRTQYELAALEMEEFHTKTGADERLKVILRRRVRPGLPIDPNRPVTAPPPIPSSEVIDLTLSDEYERSSQSSYLSPPLHEPGHGGFSLPVQPPPGQHGGHAGPQIFDDRFPQRPFDSPIGEEQPRPPHREHGIRDQEPDHLAGLGGKGNRPPHRDQVILDQQPDHLAGFGGKGNRPPHRDQVILDQQPDHFPGFGGSGNHGNDNSENKKGKGDKSKGKQKQQRDESDSSSGSEAEIGSVDSAGTPLSTISSRSSYRVDKRPLHGSPQPQFRTNGHDDRDRGSREEKIYKKESHRFAPGGHDGESRGRGFEEKMYRHDGPKAGSSGHDRGNHGSSSKKDKSYYPDSHHRRSVSVDRDDRGRNDKKEKKYQHESRRDSHSHERSEHSYKAENRYRPESHSSKSDRHHRDNRRIATREHVRKVPVARPRESWSEGSTSYTDEDYIVIPQSSSRRSYAAPQSLYQETPVRSRRALIGDEESLEYVPRPLGRSNTAYRPKLANKPFRQVDLHDSRFDYAHEKAELQRQRDLELQREEDRIVAQQVRECLAKEDEEMMLRHQRRTEMAREESERRIAIKVREEFQRARLGRERPYDEYELPLRTRRASAAYDFLA